MKNARLRPVDSMRLAFYIDFGEVSEDLSGSKVAWLCIGEAGMMTRGNTGSAVMAVDVVGTAATTSKLARLAWLLRTLFVTSLINETSQN